MVFLFGIGFPYCDATKIVWPSMVNNGAFALLFFYGKYALARKATNECLAIILNLYK